MTSLVQARYQENRSGMTFEVKTSPGSRRHNLVPMRMQGRAEQIIFTSYKTVVMEFNSKLFHFNLDGTLHNVDIEHADYEKIKKFYKKGFLISQSELT